MNTLFSKLNAAIVNPLTAPPVPNNPAVNPDREPPIKEFFFVGLTSSFLRMRNKLLKRIKNIPRATSNHTLLKTLERYPPMITNITEGAPIYSNRNLLSPFLNKKILLILLDR